MMRNKIRRGLYILALVWATALLLPAMAQSRLWHGIKGQPLVKFDWNCATTSAYPSAKLNRILKATMKKNEFAGAGSWGDRAVAFDLNGDRKPEYFVPLGCGATGNCTWGVFSLNPTRLIGLLGAESIYVHKREGRHPAIITYIHMSAAEGILSRYNFRKGRYARLGGEYPTDDRGGIYGNKVPTFLDRARAACEKLGN